MENKLEITRELYDRFAVVITNHNENLLKGTVSELALAAFNYFELIIDAPPVRDKALKTLAEIMDNKDNPDNLRFEVAKFLSTQY